MTPDGIEKFRSAAGLRAVVADDSVLLREGIVRLLREARVDVVGQAGEVNELIRKVRAHKPDVAVIDVRMPPSNTNEGLRAAIKIRTELPEIGVLVLSQYIEGNQAIELLADSAAGFGYLLKDRIVDVAQFVDALKRVASGGSALDPLIVSRLLGRIETDHPLGVLTKREYEVLGLMAEGRTNGAIAERLCINIRSAEKNVTKIFQKLNLESTPDDHRRVLAVLKFMQGQ